MKKDLDTMCLNEKEDDSYLIKDKDIKTKMELKHILLLVFVPLAVCGVFLSFNHSKASDYIMAGEFLLASALLTYISILDIKLHLCPNWPAFVFLALSIPLIVFNIVTDVSPVLYCLIDPLVGAAIGFIPLYIAAVCSKGGIGGADIKIMGALGFMLGANNALFVLFFGLLLAILFNGAKILFKKQTKKDAFAFLPYISMAAFIIMCLPK